MVIADDDTETALRVKHPQHSPSELHDDRTMPYIDGGDQGAIDWLRDNSDLTYHMDRWYFGDVEDVEIRGPYGRD